MGETAIGANVREVRSLVDLINTVLEPDCDALDIAQTIIDSDWLADHDRAAIAERDEALAAVERVRALADQAVALRTDDTPPWVTVSALRTVIGRIAALDGPAPEPTQPTGVDHA